jgi:competence protein ComEC
MRFKEILKSPSKTFAIFLAMFCFGILFGPAASWMSQFYILIILAIILFSTAILKKKKYIMIAIALFLFVFGLFRYVQSEVPNNIPTIQNYAGSTLRVSGVIDSEVESKLSSQRVILKNVEVADKNVFGKMLVHLPLYPKVSYSDKLVFNCSIKTPEPFNGFRYDKFLESKGVLAVCYYPNYTDVIKSKKFSLVGGILKIKEKANLRISKIIPDPHSTFLSGLLFGGSSGLSKELTDDFSRTGTSHILAASGFNVSLFSFVFLGWVIQTRLGRRRGIYLTAGLLLVYVVMAGMGPAVVRATLLAFVILTGALIGRKESSVNALLFVGSVILLFNPRLLLDDVGFQLSFVATAAIMFLTPKWRDSFKFLPESFGFRESFVGSLAAITATLPIIIYHFGAISIIAPITNFLILPFIPYLMAFLALALFVSVLSLQTATLFALPAWALSFIILHIIKFSASLPFALVALGHNKEIGAAVGVLLLLILFWVYGKARHFHIRSLV